MSICTVHWEEKERVCLKGKDRVCLQGHIGKRKNGGGGAGVRVSECGG